MASLAGGRSSSKLPMMSRWCFSYKLRQFRSKGALLTLVWSFAGSMLLTYLVGCNCYVAKLHYHAVTITAGMALFYPLAGWLADVRYGRYKFITVTLGILWVTKAVTIVCSVVEELSDLHTRAFQWIKIISFVVDVITLGGFQANIVQFGIDQLVDASSREISSFISWYIWTFFLGNTMFYFTQTCLCSGYQGVIDVLIQLCLTIAVCSNFVFKKWLILEPVSYNPLKLIFRVLQYAAKNKYPRLRSAFTYWDDKPYSRIDLAKAKYGGPFSTEQVEDVKTFCRMLTLICCLSQFVCLIFIVSTVSLQLMYHYYDGHYENECSFTDHYMKNCFKRMLVQRFGYILMVVIIPVVEFVVNPLFIRLVSFLSIAKKMIAGMLLLLIYNFNLLLFEIVGYAYTHDVSSQNQTFSIPCLLLAGSSNLLAGETLSVSYKWLLLPNMLNGIALYMVVKAAIEFICAQSPYSMKGLLIGVVYAMTGLAIFLASLLKLPVMNLFKMHKLWYGCGVWYFLATSLLNILILTATCGLIKWYSRRRRDEDIHNEQIFAVNYYDHYTRFNTEDED